MTSRLRPDVVGASQMSLDFAENKSEPCPTTYRGGTRVAIVISLIQFFEALGFGMFLLYLTEPNHFKTTTIDLQNLTGDALKDYISYCGTLKEQGFEIMLIVYISAYILFFLHTVMLFIGNEWKHTLPFTAWNFMVILEISGSAAATIYFVLITDDKLAFFKDFNNNLPQFVVFMYLSRTFFIQWLIKLILVFVVSKRRIVIQMYRTKGDGSKLTNDIEMVPSSRTMTIPRPKTRAPRANFDELDGEISPQYHGEEVSYDDHRRSHNDQRRPYDEYRNGERRYEKNHRPTSDDRRRDSLYDDKSYDRRQDHCSERQSAPRRNRSYDERSVASNDGSVDRFTLTGPSSRRTEKAVNRLSQIHSDGVPGLRSRGPVPAGAKPAVGTETVPRPRSNSPKKNWL